jgi:glycosyltransferase involved in cell wall biosynthesis
MVRFIHRTADLGIVTNEGLVPVVEANGGRAVVLPDRVPDLAPCRSVPPAAADLVVFVCSFAPDEPYREVIEAARELEGVARVAITGRPANVDTQTLPANVTLTGFLTTEDYEHLLASAAVVVDLTSMEDCLVCGAYEAVALGKPLVTSDTAALRQVFDRGTVFTRHTRAAMASAISMALARAAELSAEMTILRQALHDSWNARRDMFADRLAELCDVAPPVEAPSAATHN